MRKPLQKLAGVTTPPMTFSRVYDMTAAQTRLAGVGALIPGISGSLMKAPYLTTCFSILSRARARLGMLNTCWLSSRLDVPKKPGWSPGQTKVKPTRLTHSVSVVGSSTIDSQPPAPGSCWRTIFIQWTRRQTENLQIAAGIRLRLLAAAHQLLADQSS
jgi:hypothetical protein